MEVKIRDSNGAKLIGRERSPNMFSFRDGCFTARMVIHPNTTHEYPTAVTLLKSSSLNRVMRTWYMPRMSKPERRSNTREYCR
jgi:hypothetical protein